MASSFHCGCTCCSMRPRNGVSRPLFPGLTMERRSKFISDRPLLIRLCLPSCRRVPTNHSNETSTCGALRRYPRAKTAERAVTNSFNEANPSSVPRCDVRVPGHALPPKRLVQQQTPLQLVHLRSKREQSEQRALLIATPLLGSFNLLPVPQFRCCQQ